MWYVWKSTIDCRLRSGILDTYKLHYLGQHIFFPPLMENASLRISIRIYCRRHISLSPRSSVLYDSRCVIKLLFISSIIYIYKYVCMGCFFCLKICLTRAIPVTVIMAVFYICTSSFIFLIIFIICVSLDLFSHPYITVWLGLQSSRIFWRKIIHLLLVKSFKGWRFLITLKSLPVTVLGNFPRISFFPWNLVSIPFGLSLNLPICTCIYI